MLIILSGLPGTGKTTIARELAHQLAAVHVRIDSIEQALQRSGVSVFDHGYQVGYAVAEDNLRLGRVVVADSVNPLEITRQAWIGVARRAGVPALEVEVICSDVEEHRRRIEERHTDVEGLRLPTWEDVLARDYDAWERGRVTVDTQRMAVHECVAVIRRALAYACR